jgi:hypothetical protein
MKITSIVVSVLTMVCLAGAQTAPPAGNRTATTARNDQPASGPTSTPASLGSPQDRKAPNTYFETGGGKVYGADGKLLAGVNLFLDSFGAEAAGKPDADQVAPLVAAGGKDVASKAKTVIKMDKAMPSKIPGLNTATAIRTIVIPRRDMKLGDKIKGGDVLIFGPGEVRNLTDLIAKVGPPPFQETWCTPESKWFGLDAKTYWWHGVGIAVDGKGAITHILIRG